MQLWAIWMGLWIFAVSSAFGQQIPPTLDELIAEIKQQEALYANLQMKWKGTQEIQGGVRSPGNRFMFGQTTGVYTVRGENYRLETHRETFERSDELVDGVHCDVRTTHGSKYGFDGVQTHSVSTSVREGQLTNFGMVGPGDIRQTTRIYHPHGTLLGLAMNHKSLSDWLTRWNQNPEFKITVEGFMQKAEEPCVKIMVHRLRESNVPEAGAGGNRQTWEIWLATNRNYQDVAIEIRDEAISDTVPHVTGKVLSFREIEKGIFVPDQIHIDATGFDVDKKEKSHLMTIHNTFKVTECILDPKIPDNYFSDIVFPVGTTVNVYDENRKRVKRYVQGKNE